MKATVAGRPARTLVAAAMAAVLPAFVAAAPTPPPPAPPQQLGTVTVVSETQGTRTIRDSAGQTHVVMKKVTQADRKAAATRARATRQAAALKNLSGEKSEVSK
jgi:hypothetical protein